MKFESISRHAPGETLRLTFTLPETSVAIRSSATVIYQAESGNRFLTGIQFKDIGLAERKMIRQVAQYLISGLETSNKLIIGDNPALYDKNNTSSDKKLKPDEPYNDCNNNDMNQTLSAGSQNSSELIVKQCVAGDKKAQHEFFFRYRDTVLGLVCRLLGPDFDIDDVIQQVFISIFRSLESFKGLSSLDTWVYRITSKVCTDQLRKKYRKRKLVLAGSLDDENSGLTGSTYQTPASGLERKELYNSINTALGKLTSEKRIVVIMYEVEGKSLEEIAEVIEKPVGTVKSRLFHARRELEKHLRKYMERPE
jgi:RNA polymerase sigma-70 factor (ECF subfamily)